MPRPTNRPPRHEMPEDDGTLLEDSSTEESPDGATMVFNSNAFVEEDAVEQSPDGATMVLDASSVQHSRRPSIHAKLKVTGGPRTGDEFDLGPGDTTLGRQNDCTIVIADISVSRKHVLLRRQGAAFILQDLGSGNGTFFNGERLEGEVELRDGDVFMIGDSEVTFAMQTPGAPKALARPHPKSGPVAGPPRPSSAPPRPAPVTGRRPGPRPAPRGVATLGDEADGEEMTGRLRLDRSAAQKNQRKKLIVATAVVGVLVTALFLWKKSQESDAAAAKSAEIEALIAAASEEMTDAIEKGKDFTKAGNFRAATKAFDFALGKAGEVEELGGDASNQARDVKNRIEYAKKEVISQDAVEKIREHIVKLELAQANTAIRGIPEDSWFVDKVPELMTELKRKIPDKLIQARGLLASKNLAGATAAIEDVLAVDPENVEAKKISDEIERAGAPKPSTPRPVAEKVDYAEKALSAFRGGKIDEAIGILAVCEEIECAKLSDKIAAFKTANEKGSSDALRKCKAIPGCEQSPFFAPLAGKAAGDLVREGIKLMSAEDYCKAFKRFYEALKAEPNNAVAGKHMGTIHSKAKELFQQAYVDKGVDAEKARREFEQVICMTAPDDELNQKSQRHLKSLGGGY